MDALFAAYAEALPRVRAWVDETFARAEGEPDAARRRAVKAKALDLLRGLLPAASLSHMGIYAHGPGVRAADPAPAGDPLPEARAYGSMILDAIKATMPSFVSRVERPDRGGEWVAYLERRREATERWVARLGLDRREVGRRPAVGAAAARRRRRGPPARRAAVRGGRRRARTTRWRRCARCPTRSAPARWPTSWASARNRRHRPGRGFEALRYRFEIVSDYGAFRDLQRHRMLTVQWQALTPDLGAAVPDEVAAAGCGELYAAGARALARGVRAAHRRRARGRGAVRALPRLPDPLRARHERARGDAPDRAALGPRGPSVLPRGRARAARADRRPPPGGRRRDGLRRPLVRAAPRAHPRRDARRAGAPRAR